MASGGTDLVALGMRDRRRLLGDRSRQGPARAGNPVRLLREVRPGRRQLGVRQPQRDVVGIPLAAHQHLARADGVLGLPDAQVVSRLPAPHAHRAVLQRLRRPLRLPRPDRVRDRRRARSDAVDDGVWTITLDNGETRTLRRAAGRQRPPLEPTLARAGVPRRRSTASRCTPTTTSTTSDFRDKNVLVVGIGNSAMDIAVESSFVARRTFLSSRRGAYILPKYLFGRPLDQIGVNALTPVLPWVFRRAILTALYRLGVGRGRRTTACPSPTTSSARPTPRSRPTSSTASPTAR